MSVCLVTGAAGFIGSHLTESLLGQGHQVVGVDAFIPYYPRARKEQNLDGIRYHPNFRLLELDLRSAPLTEALADVEVVFHLAAQAGLLRSWADFDSYLTCNVQATERLLAAATKAQVDHFIHCSTSSVYGRIATGGEATPLDPVSPYGITKLAAEQLCWAYARKDDLPVTILRLFSVYGPRQRPDMGFSIFIERMLADQQIVIDGDGNDSRSNTYVLDCIAGIIQAFKQPEKSIGQAFNIGGGEEVTVNQVLAILAGLIGKEPIAIHGPQRPGDQRRTAANIAKAKQTLGYRPLTSIETGLRAQLAWQASFITSAATY